MTQPIISWTDVVGEPITDIDFGTVDAGDISGDFEVCIWNNKGGAVVVPTMLDCTITTRDILGGIGTDETLTAAESEIILNQWIEGKITSSTAFSPIGGTNNLSIQAEGDVYDGANLLTGAISGEANSGSTSTDIVNYCLLTLRANIPSDASSGNVNFFTRVSYKYI